jgi:integrase
MALANGIRYPKRQKRERLLTGDELSALGAALAAEQSAGGEQFATIFRLLLLTGAHKNEIVHLKWTEVDLSRGVLNLQDSKTGEITLGAAPLAMFEELHTGRGGHAHVFPDPRDPKQPIRGVDWAWARVCDRAGLPDLRIHDLRLAYASTGATSGLSLMMVGKLLGHAGRADSPSTSRYADPSDDPVKDAADRIAAQISSALDGAAA